MRRKKSPSNRISPLRVGSRSRFSFLEMISSPLNSSGKRISLPSAVLRNQQGALQAEEADCGRTVEFRLAGEFAAAVRRRIQRERQRSRRRAGKVEPVVLEPSALFFLQIEYLFRRGGLQGVPLGGECGKRSAPSVKFEGAAVEQPGAFSPQECGGDEQHGKDARESGHVSFPFVVKISGSIFAGDHFPAKSLPTTPAASLGCRKPS